jgi:hypothetical protein
MDAARSRWRTSGAAHGTTKYIHQQPKVRPTPAIAFDVSYAQAFALEHLNAAGYRAAAAAAGAALAKQFDTTTPSAWREPRRIYDVTVQGLADKPPLPFFDRGTWQQEAEFGQ